MLLTLGFAACLLPVHGIPGPHRTAGAADSEPRKGWIVMKLQFERSGGTYTEIDGISYPNIAPPEPDPRPIGIWGMRHEEYLREHRYLTYVNLLTTGKLDSYLADIDEQARDVLDRLITQMAESEGITEELKARDQMEWVRRMNNVGHRAEDIVMRELICA